MKAKSSLLLPLFALIILTNCKEKVKNNIPVSYPETKKVDHKDTYFETVVEDPYQWLEDDNAQDTKEWVEAENKVTHDYLSKVPYREKIEKRYAELFNYPKLTAPTKAGDNYFFSKKEGLQNQYVIYIQKGLQGKPEVFLDANKAKEDGTLTYSLSGFSDDYKYVAVSISEAGSDWKTIGIMDVEKKEWLEDKIEWMKSGYVSWYKDGFFYSRYPQPKKGDELSGVNNHMKVYYHQFRTDQSNDELVYEDKENAFMFNYGFVTEDEKYLILYKATGTDGNEVYFKDLSKPGWNFTPLFTGFKNNHSVIDHYNGKFLIQTDLNAPNYKLVAIDPKNTAEDAWQPIIPESEILLQGVSAAGGKLFAEYLEKATSKFKQFDMNGKFERDIELPGPGTAKGFYGKRDYKQVFYSFTSFTDPGSIFTYDIPSGQSELFYQVSLKFNPQDYEAKQVFYKSKDGTDVSMFIVHKKGLKMNGDNPCYLYAYGGFNVTMTPSFSTSRIILLENGGVFAMPNLRGGGEYGEEWHKAGMLTKKQNVFDDFISAAEYLITEGYTSSEKLAIAGGSNGGLLVGAVMTQRPELYKVAFPAVGVMDMLKFHQFTVGKGWVPEYGSSEQSKEMFEYLLGYSPYHNLKKGIHYPATMVTTADHDDRVVPAHSFKFAARLQEMHSGDNPVLIRIGTSAGHGAGKPTSKIIEEQADQWAFMFQNMGITDVVIPENSDLNKIQGE